MVLTAPHITLSFCTHLCTPLLGLSSPVHLCVFTWPFPSGVFYSLWVCLSPNPILRAAAGWGFLLSLGTAPHAGWRQKKKQGKVRMEEGDCITEAKA